MDTQRLETEVFRPRPPQERAARQRQALIRLARPAPSDFAGMLRDATRLAARTLEVERVSVWLFTPDRATLRLANLYQKTRDTHGAGVEFKVADYPAYFKAMDSNDVLAAHDARTDARTREFMEGYLRPLGITSMLDAPIYVEGVLRGVVCHEHVGLSRTWSEDEETFAVAMASFVALAIGQDARRGAEHALAESEMRYRLVARATGDAIWDWDLATKQVTWNEAIHTALGHETVVPHETWWIENIHPQDRDRIVRGIHGVIDGGGSEWSDDYRFRRGDGSYAHIYDRGTVIRDGEGRATRMIGAMLDLSPRKQAESELKESQERFRELADNVQEVFWLRDLKSARVIYVNAAFDVVWGLPRQALLDRPELWLESIHPDDRGRVTLPQGGDFAEYRIVRPDGRIRWIRDRAFPVRNEKGEVYRMAGVAEDITERKEAEEILRFQKSLLEAQSEAAQDGILVVSREGRILSHNRRVVELWGVPDDIMETSSEVVALNYLLNRLVNPRDFLGRLRYLREHPEEMSTTEELQLTDGRVFDYYSTPVRAGGKGVYGRVWFFRDVTARKRLEAQLRQGQKMEGIGRLAGGVAHDFNNLLTAILGYTDVLAGKLAGQDGVMAELTEIRMAGERAAALTSQLLAFSRQQPVQPKVLDLNDVVGRIEKMLRRLIGEDIELATRLAPGLSSVKADVGQLDQILMNLAVNARDAMPKGGRLTIETKDVDLTGSFELDHPGAKAGPHVMLRVSDSGVGMPKEVLTHLFEPFFTTKEMGKGTGLGLATVYGIVKQNGGYVGVRSEEGRGTSFEIYLPRIAERATRTDETQMIPILKGSGRILLVEDEGVVRALVRQTLKLQGYTVVEAANGEEAMELLKNETRAFDLLMTDLIMPRVGGRELARSLTSRWPEMPVLYMSGYTDDAAFREGGLEPGATLLSKPFSPNQMLAKVRKVLQRAAREKAVSA